MTIRVLIADDQELIRTGIQATRRGRLPPRAHLDHLRPGRVRLRGAAGRRQPDVLADLTARGLEVMRLLARGMSNTGIARELFLGDATVKTHIARIFTKLSLHDRA